MNKHTYITLTAAAAILAPLTAQACAPIGSVNNNIINDCPVVLSYDFDPSDPTDVVNSSVTGMSLTNGTSVASATNDYGYTANNVFLNDSSDRAGLSFTVATGKTIDLEGIQLNNYWTTEPVGRGVWDFIWVQLKINGSEVAKTLSNGTSYISGYRGTTDGLTVSNDYWEFTTSAPNIGSSNTITANSGDFVEINIYSASSQGSGRGNNRLAMEGLTIYGCTTAPEPSSSLLTSLGLLTLFLRRKR